MADALVDGRIKVWSVPAIANIAAPTTTELNLGMALESFLTPDGLIGFRPETQPVDTSALNSTYSTKSPGRIELTGTMLRVKRQTGTDLIFNTFVYGYTTNIVIRWITLASTAWASSDKVGVYPGSFGEWAPLDPEANSVSKAEFPFFVSPQPNTRAVVA